VALQATTPSRRLRTADTEVTSMASANVTRRSLLKRAGVGAAVLGAGSMVTASMASAQEGGAHCRDAGGCGAAAGFPPCTIHGGDCCLCGVDQEGCCVCFENIFCADTHNCTANGDCPPGWTCGAFPNGCGHAVCVPICGTPTHLPSPCDALAAGGATFGGGGGAASHHPEPEAPPHRGHGHQ
jgi:hypothetical protein